MTIRHASAGVGEPDLWWMKDTQLEREPDVPLEWTSPRAEYLSLEAVSYVLAMRGVDQVERQRRLHLGAKVLARALGYASPEGEAQVTQDIFATFVDLTEQYHFGDGLRVRMDELEQTGASVPRPDELVQPPLFPS